MSTVFRVSRYNVDALTASTPNDFILSSEWNTPKIIKEDGVSPALGTNGSESFSNLAHGLNYTPFAFPFVKFANNRVGMPGTKASNVWFTFTNFRINATNARFGYLNNTGGSYTPTFRYLATEIPLAGTPSIAVGSGQRLAVAKSGIEVTTETNPNNLIFDSRFGSLKYFAQGVSSITVPGGTLAPNENRTYETALYTHNLGYYPFFTGNGEFVDFPGYVHIMPMTFADAGFWQYIQLYMTTTQLIFNCQFGDAFGGSFSVGNITGGFVRIDGANKRIIVNDGTTNRIIIGEV